MTDPERPTLECQRRGPYFWLVIGLPLVAVAAGFVTLAIALRSDDGLVADDYYKRGLAINRDLHREETARRHGLTATLETRSQGQLQIRLQGKSSFHFPTSLQMQIVHPTRSASDFSLTLMHQGDGIYTGRFSPIPPGRRYVLIEGQDWRLQTVWNFP